jgi:DNA-binding NtrC family response regulator
MITAYASTESAIEALKMGASDYIVKPFNMEEIKIIISNELDKRRLERENLLLKSQLKKKHEFGEIVGKSPRMMEILSMIYKIADTNTTILISGESGTGKEAIARAIHDNSSRRDKQFVSINCGALPEGVLESELFGHMKGSFTGAEATKSGLFEIADKGTIFLDEIGETSPAMQVKLLRVLQDRKVRRVGGTEEMEVDVRVIAATNQNLEKLVKDKKFREDLYYRINVIEIKMPPLREKTEDIPILAKHFLEKFNKAISKDIKSIGDSAMEALQAYHWPGNVRELENAMERAVTLEISNEIRLESLPKNIRMGNSGVPQEWKISLGSGMHLESYLEDLRKEYMSEALDKCKGVQSQAAKMLGMTFRSFRYFAKKYGFSGQNGRDKAVSKVSSGGNE